MTDIELEWITVTSKSVSRIAYEADARRLHVRFANGGEGYYGNVQPDVYTAFFTTKSKGLFVGRRLKPFFVWTRTSAIESDIRAAHEPRDDDRYRYKCRFCGTLRTLPEDVVLPRHKPKGARDATAADCPGSGSPGLKMGFVRAEKK